MVNNSSQVLGRQQASSTSVSLLRMKCSGTPALSAISFRHRFNELRTSGSGSRFSEGGDETDEAGGEIPARLLPRSFRCKSFGNDRLPRSSDLPFITSAPNSVSSMTGR